MIVFRIVFKNMPNNEEAGGDNIEHIFGGIPEGLLRLEISAEENLANLRADFSRLGIVVGAETKIANSSQKALVELVNSIVSPTPPEDVEAGQDLDESSAELSPDSVSQLKVIREAGRTRNFGMQIVERVLIGEDFQPDPQIAIGDDTIIGDGVKFNIGAKVGKNCDIGDFGFLGPFARLEDSVIMQPRATVALGQVVPSRSIAEYDAETGRTIIVPRIRGA